jgi:hypothetical protein
LKATQGGDAVITVFDSKGVAIQKIRRSILAGMNQVIVDMSTLPVGVYTVSVNWGNSVRSERVVKK